LENLRAIGNRAIHADLQLDSPTANFYTGLMEVHFTPDEATRLSEIAAHEGIGAEQLVKDAALHLLEDDARFRAAVQKGLEQADRGEFIDEEEMCARMKAMLGS
jgi:predicted transcriptional regulator